MHAIKIQSLNAPFGARCFLTLWSASFLSLSSLRLNAPFGARCFLTLRHDFQGVVLVVLMHLLALGAF